MEHSVPYTPHLNGVAERKNRSLKEMETYLLHAENLPPSLWAEAVNCASYLQNSVPHKSVVGGNPFEALHGYKPNVSHLRVFGSKAWARIPLDKRKAFQPKVVNAFCWDMQKMKKLTNRWRLLPEDASLKEVSSSKKISCMILLQQHRKV